jgi:tetratricopeptide (TPR) repeat protein
MGAAEMKPGVGMSIFSTRSSFVFLLALAASLSITAAEERLTYAQALQAIEQSESAARLAGIERLAEIGSMDDAEKLVASLSDEDEQVREQATAALWEIWSRSGDPEIDTLYQLGVDQMQTSQLPEALETFSEIIRRKPSFAEAWNKRATVHFMMGRNDLSLKDCDEVLKRNRHHFGALSGVAQIYLSLGKPDRALEYFDRALTLNPSLPGATEAARMLDKQLQERGRNMI